MKPIDKPTLLFIRHGENSANRDHRELPGWGDAEDSTLDPKGQAEIEAAANKVKDYPISHIYSSPLKRARQTAQIVSKTTGAPVTHAQSVGPWDYGVMTGQPDNEESRKVLQHYMSRPKLQVPKGESYGDFLQRFGGAVQKLRAGVEQNPSQAVAVVTHSRNLYPLKHILDGKSSIPVTGGYDPGSVMKVEFDPAAPDGFRMSKL